MLNGVVRLLFECSARKKISKSTLGCGNCRRCLRCCFAHKNKIPATLRLQLPSTFQVSLEILPVDKRYAGGADTKSQAAGCVWVSQEGSSFLPTAHIPESTAVRDDFSLPARVDQNRCSWSHCRAGGHSGPLACGLQAQLFQDIVPASDCYSSK